MKIYVFTDRQKTANNKQTDRQTVHIDLLHFSTCISTDVLTLMYKKCIDRQTDRHARQLSADKTSSKLMGDSISIVMEQCNAIV